MNTLYWITRLDAINCICWIVIIACVLLCISFIAVYMSILDDYYMTDGERKMIESIKRWSREVFTVFIISIAVVTFVPTSKEALVIYGVGGCLDYINGSERAKDIPDKVIKACDAYLSKMLEDSKQDKKE